MLAIYFNYEIHNAQNLIIKNFNFDDKKNFTHVRIILLS